MPNAITYSDSTEGSNVWQASDNGTPPVDWPLHLLVDDAIPPGSLPTWYAVHGSDEYFYFTVDAALVPADMDRTGDSGFGIALYHATLNFILPCSRHIRGYVSGSPVTNLRKFVMSGVQVTHWLTFPAEEITENWDGSKGYLTRTQFQNLELRWNYKDGIGGEIEPPEYS